MHSPDKAAGRDVGDIIGTGPLGVVATDSIVEILALDADAVVYSPLLPDPDEVAALFRSCSRRNVSGSAVDQWQSRAAPGDSVATRYACGSPQTPPVNLT